MHKDMTCLHRLVVVLKNIFKKSGFSKVYKTMACVHLTTILAKGVFIGIFVAQLLLRMGNSVLTVLLIVRKSSKN